MTIATLEDLERIYGSPGATSTLKVTQALIPEYRAFIERSRFAVLVTVGPEGTDGSPRGDEGPVVRIVDDRTLWLPDWAGNNRVDSLRNIVRDGRVSLMFMVPGSANVVRVNGTARLTADPAVTGTFDRDGRHPRSVIVLTVAEVYFQCARALKRSDLWSGRDDSAGLPTAGQMLAAASAGTVGGPDYDRDWPARAAGSMW